METKNQGVGFRAALETLRMKGDYEKGLDKGCSWETCLSNSHLFPARLWLEIKSGNRSGIRYEAASVRSPSSSHTAANGS